MFKVFKKKYVLMSTLTLLNIIGCGELIDRIEDRPTPPVDELNFENKGRYVDSNVSGIHYLSKSGCEYVEQSNSEESKEVCAKTIEGNTSSDGTFGFIVGGEGVEFSIAGLSLDYIAPKYLINNAVVTVTENNAKLASFLQSMDNDGNASNGIVIFPEVVEVLKDLNVSQYSSISNTELDVATLVSQINSRFNTSSPSQREELLNQKSSSINLRYINETEALSHLQSTIAYYKTAPSITVDKVIEDIKNLDKNVQGYSEEEILEKVKAIRTQLDNPLEGDRGLVDIQIAQALLDISELSNQTYLEDVFSFEGDTSSRLSQIIKEMALDPNNADYQPLVRGKDENATNIIDVGKKGTLGLVTNLKSISDRLGISLATLPQHYKFEYEGISISIDNISILRATLLALASKMSLSLAYNVGIDSNYIPQTYIDNEGNKYQFTYANLYMDKMINTQGFGEATQTEPLKVAKEYLLESALILKNLTASSIQADLNETKSNDLNQNSDNQKVIDYAKKLYTVLSDGSGTFTLTNKNGGENGQKEAFEIALNRMFDIETALKSNDWGTNWAYSCGLNRTLGTEKENKIHNEQVCFQEFNGNRYASGSAELNATITAEAETSGLDELIGKITLDDSVVKTGQEVIDYLLREKSKSISPVSPSQVKFTYEKVAGKSYYAVHENGTEALEFRFNTLGTNTVSSYDITSGIEISSNQSFTLTNEGHIVFQTLDFTLLEENVNNQYERVQFRRTDNSGDTVRFFYNKSDALNYLGARKNFKYLGSDRAIVTAPNGGETFLTNSNPSITWNQNKLTSTFVRLYLLDDNPSDLYSYSDINTLKTNKKWIILGGESSTPLGSSPSLDIPAGATGFSNSGSYSITARELADKIGNEYIILVTSEDETQWDISDGVFSINPTP